MSAASLPTSTEAYDVVIVGGGHNGLTAAAYLARAGKRVLVLERADATGGAAVTAPVFDGVDAWLSRYSYLVSLLPQRIIDDLGLNVRLVTRRFSSYTPDPSDPTRGILMDGHDADRTLASLERAGAADDARNIARFYERCRVLTEALWPTVTEPLLRRSEARRLVEAGGDPRAAEVWRSMIDTPIGQMIAESLTSDLVRGLVLSDALIGTFARADDDDLRQNVCFLYHVMGRGTGEWMVPAGGMGAITGELVRAARSAGAEILTSAEVTAIDPHGRVDYRYRDTTRTVAADWILSNVAPAVLERLVGERTSSGGRPGEPSLLPFEARPFGPSSLTSHSPEGAQVKVNLLVTRLPRLADPTVAPEEAFSGTVHVNETWTQLDAAFEHAAAGAVPDPLPCEVYSHSLTDPTILSPELREQGVHALTVFGLQVPHRLFGLGDAADLRGRLQRAVLRSLDSVLAEPIEPLILAGPDGRACIETVTTSDLEREIGMPGGNIFHGLLTWPFAEEDEELETAAQRWGVATRHPRVLLCGAGSRRGGGVSGIGGHNAAMAVLEG